VSHLDWRDHTNDMTTAERAAALNAHQYNAFDDDEQFKEYIGELTAFGHACAAAAERERDQLTKRLAEVHDAYREINEQRDTWRRKALDAENHPAVKALLAERDEARGQRDGLMAALARIATGLDDHQTVNEIAANAIAAAEGGTK
jgi:hypothetical protein